MTDAEKLYRMMVAEQATKFDTTEQVIERAHLVFAGAEPKTIAAIHKIHGYHVSLADCIAYLKSA